MLKTTTNSSAVRNLYQAKMGPSSNTKTAETHNLDDQTSSNCFEKKRRCYTSVSQPYSWRHTNTKHFPIFPNQTHLNQLISSLVETLGPEIYWSDKETSKMCTVGVPPGTGLGNTVLHHGKHAPVPTILRPVAGIKFEMS